MQRWISFCFFLVSFVLSGVAFASDPIEIKNHYSGDEPHIVFLVHGLAGDIRTFAGLNKILRDRYGKRVTIRSLSYDTVEKADERTDESGFLTVEEFKLQAFVKLVSFLYDRKKRGIVTSVAPSFSIISHSQGGLVVRDLLKDCLYPAESQKQSPCSYKEGLKIGSLKNKRSGSNKFYYEDVEEKEKYGRELAHYKNIKHWFIYGTPFGGSPQASKLFGGILAAFKKALDSEEARDLKNGSQALVADRTDQIDLALAKEKGKRKEEGFPSGLEIYTFGGDIAEIEGRGNRFAFVRELFSSGVETDVVVPISSSRLDMLYYRESGTGQQWADAVKGVTKFSTGFFPIKMPHTKLGRMPGMMSVKDVVNGPDDPSYQHVGLDLLAEVLDVFFGDSDRADFGRATIRDEYVASLDNFSVEMKILPAPGYDRLPDLTDSAVKPSVPDGVPIDVAVFNDGLFYKASGINKEMGASEPRRTFTSFYHWGRFSEASALMAIDWLGKNQQWRPNTTFTENPEDYPNRLKYVIYERMGWRSRTVVLPVAPTYLTYAEIYLEPFLPIRPIGTKLGTPEGISGELNHEDGRVLEPSDLLREEFPGGAHVVAAYDVSGEKTRLFLTSPDPEVRKVKTVDVARRQLFREVGSVNSGNLQKLRIRRTQLRGAQRKMQCKVGHFADRRGRHFNALFSGNESDEVLSLMEHGDTVEIIGRVIKTDGKGHETDMYLMTSEKIRNILIAKGLDLSDSYPFVYASRFDIDIDKGEKCDLKWLPK